MVQGHSQPRCSGCESKALSSWDIGGSRASRALGWRVRGCTGAGVGVACCAGRGRPGRPLRASLSTFCLFRSTLTFHAEKKEKRLQNVAFAPCVDVSSLEEFREFPDNAISPSEHQASQAGRRGRGAHDGRHQPTSTCDRTLDCSIPHFDCP